jgi:hypothetical protein
MPSIGLGILAREVEVVYAIFIPAVLSNISIDIVEDYAEFRSMLGRFLMLEGVRVVCDQGCT